MSLFSIQRTTCVNYLNFYRVDRRRRKWTGQPPETCTPAAAKPKTHQFPTQSSENRSIVFSIGSHIFCPQASPPASIVCTFFPYVSGNKNRNLWKHQKSLFCIQIRFYWSFARFSAYPLLQWVHPWNQDVPEKWAVPLFPMCFCLPDSQCRILLRYRTPVFWGLWWCPLL